MVGPRSTGCRTCVTRRVKCDGGRPECQRCIKRNLKCPGYRQAIQWLEPETIKRTKLPLRTSSSESSSSSGSSPTSSPSAIWSATQSPARSDQLSSLGSSISPGPPPADTEVHQINRDWSSSPLVSPSPYTDDVYCTFFIDRYFCVGHLDGDFQFNKSWFWSAIRSPDTAPVSNKACRALITGFFSNVQRSPQLTQESMDLHSQALIAMRRHIQHTVDLDGICAVSLLQMYEACQYTGPRAWQEHSIGMLHMFQMKGPDYFKKRPARSVFAWMKVQFITEATIARRRCFLEAPEWQEVLKGGDGEESITMRLSNIVVFLPGIMQDATAVSQTRDAVEAHGIFNRLSQLIHDLLDWWQLWCSDATRLPIRIPLEHWTADEMWPPPPMPGELVSTVLHFAHLEIGSTYARYHAYMIMALRWIDRLLTLDIPDFKPDLGAMPLELHATGPASYSVAPHVMISYALGIVEALHYFTLPQNCCMGAMFALVPTKQAWIVLPQDSPHSLWLEELMEFMADKSGFHLPRFALVDHTVRPGLTAKEAARRM